MTTIDKLTEIFREIFYDDTIILTESTSSSDVDGWDSFAHLNVILAVESTFGITIEDSETTLLRNVGDMVLLIDDKISKQNS